MKYHAEFEKQKGKLTQVADDPETLRLRQNTKNISNVAYHGDLQKKAAMEKQREFGEVVDNKGTLDLLYFIHFYKQNKNVIPTITLFV